MATENALKANVFVRQVSKAILAINSVVQMQTALTTEFVSKANACAFRIILVLRVGSYNLPSLIYAQIMETLTIRQNRAHVKKAIRVLIARETITVLIGYAAFAKMAGTD